MKIERRDPTRLSDVWLMLGDAVFKRPVGGPQGGADYDFRAVGQVSDHRTS